MRKISKDPVIKKRLEERMIGQDPSSHDLYHTLDGPITDTINKALESQDEKRIELVANYIGHLSGQLRELFHECLRNLTEPGCHTPRNIGEMFDFPDNWQGRERIICSKFGNLQLELILESHILRLELADAFA